MEKDPEDWTFRDVVEAEERGEEIPPEIQQRLEDAYRRFGELGREIEETLRPSLERLQKGAREFSDWLESGDPAADYILVFLSSYSDERRLAALRRILDRTGHPIARANWTRNEDAILAALDDLGTDVEGEEHTVSGRAVPAGFMAVDEAIADMTPGEVRQLGDDVDRQFRRVWRRLFRDGLLPGYDWKHNRWREVSDEVPDYVLQELAVMNDGPARVEEEVLLSVLTEYERSVLDLDQQGYSAREIADRLDTSEGAIWKAKSHAKSKVRSSFDSTE